MKQPETSLPPQLIDWVLEIDFDDLSAAAQATVRRDWSEAAYRDFRHSTARQASWLQAQPLPSPPPDLQRRLQRRLHQRRHLLRTHSGRLSAYPMAAAVALLFAAAFFGLRSGPVLPDTPAAAPIIVDSTTTDSAQQRQMLLDEDSSLWLSQPERL